MNFKKVRLDLEQIMGASITAASPEKQSDLKIRTKQFALRVIKLYSALPRTAVAQVIGKQLLGASTSVGAQYREGYRGRSKAEFISKLESVLQELDESTYWLELIVESKLMKPVQVGGLLKEADELTAILTTIVKKVKSDLKAANK
jgi:four helix bundle protein